MVSVGAVAAALVLVVLLVRDEGTTRDLEVGPADTTGAQAATSVPAVPGEWRDLPSTLSGALELSPFATALDDGRVLVLFMENGGDDVAGEIIDLSAGTVEPIAPSPLRWRAFAMVGSTGNEVIVAGGSNGPGIDVAGAAYDPAADSWRQIADPPGFQPGLGDNQAIGPGVWTGTELISWQSGLAYNPATDTWREIAESPLAPRIDEAVAATPDGVLVWGGCDRVAVPNCDDTLQAPLTDGALYDPEADAWTMLPDGPLGGGAGALAVATTWGDRAIVVVPHPADPSAPTVAAIDPATPQWQELPQLPETAGKRA